VLFGRRSHDPPDLSRGLRPGTPLHVFRKARHLPQSGAPPPRVDRPVRVEHPRRDRSAPPPAPPRALRRAVALAGFAWIGGALAEASLGLWYVGIAGVGVGAFALLHAKDLGLTSTDQRLPDSRGASPAWWWLMPASTAIVVARIAWLVLAR
jgi:hypothetical protein